MNHSICNTPVRVVIVDSLPILRLGIRTILSRCGEIAVVAEVPTIADAILPITCQRAQVVVVSMTANLFDNQETLCQLRQQAPACQVVVLSEGCNELALRGLLKAGVISYLRKDIEPADLVCAVQAAARGEPTLHADALNILLRQVVDPNRDVRKLLTEREIAVLRLIGQGLRNREIARTLYLTEGTVKGYVSALFEKLQVQDRTQAALFALRAGLVAT